MPPPSFIMEATDPNYTAASRMNQDFQPLFLNKRPTGLQSQGRMGPIFGPLTGTPPEFFAAMIQLLGGGRGGSAIGGPAMGGAPNMGGGAVGGMGGGMAGGAMPRQMGGPGSFGGGSPRVPTQDLIAASNRPLAPLPPPPGLPGGSIDKVLGQAPRRIAPFDPRQYGAPPEFRMPTYQPGGSDPLLAMLLGQKPRTVQ